MSDIYSQLIEQRRFTRAEIKKIGKIKPKDEREKLLISWELLILQKHLKAQSDTIEMIENLLAFFTTVKDVTPERITKIE